MNAKPKYQQIFDQLTREIVTGRYKPGQKFPSEAVLVKRFAASRITVGRALRELQQNGFIDRVPGSGTWVRPTPARSGNALLFGLIIPNLGETEIFEPICQGIASSPDAAGHALLWGRSDVANGGDKQQVATQMLDLCGQYIRREVSGVFFAPLEMTAGTDEVNHRVLALLKEAGTPVVLLDRRPGPASARQRCDLVGIDNHRAGFLATAHLIDMGARRIGFLSFEHQASTVAVRLAGFRDALAESGLRAAGEWTVGEGGMPFWLPGGFDAVVCANDRIAGLLMHALLSQGVRIPEDVRIAGIDDVAYASLLPVPLTTVHQPCRDIGETALRLMLERIDRPSMAARNVLLDCSLVIRRSCGSGLPRRDPDRIVMNTREHPAEDETVERQYGKPVGQPE